MPRSAPRICTYPRCGNRVHKGSRCEKHPYPERKLRNDRSQSKGYRLYKTKKWRQLRQWKLSKDPYCEQHLAHNMKVRANVVDHKRPHRGDEYEFFNKKNLRSLCSFCHNRKTAKYDGGFGNRVVGNDA